MPVALTRRPRHRACCRGPKRWCCRARFQWNRPAVRTVSSGDTGDHRHHLASRLDAGCESDRSFSASSAWRARRFSKMSSISGRAALDGLERDVAATCSPAPFTCVAPSPATCSKSRFLRRAAHTLRIEQQHAGDRRPRQQLSGIAGWRSPTTDGDTRDPPGMRNGVAVAFVTNEIAVPLQPFMGVMAVAPSRPKVGERHTVDGVQSSRPPAVRRQPGFPGAHRRRETVSARVQRRRTVLRR